MEEKEKKKGEEGLKSEPSRKHTLWGVEKEPEEKFSCFWGDLSWGVT